MKGMRFDRDVLEKRVKGTFLEVLQIEFMDDDNENLFTAKMKILPHFAQTMGVLHGGVTLAFAESVAGIGSNLLCDEGYRCLGMQISANHMSAGVIGDTIVARAEIIHKGRRSHVWRVDVYAESVQKLISTVNVTNFVIKT